MAEAKKLTENSVKGKKALDNVKTKKAKKEVIIEKNEQTENVKMKVEKVPSGVVVKKEDKEIVSKIKLPKVVNVEEKAETKTKAKKSESSSKKKTASTKTKKAATEETKAKTKAKKETKTEAATKSKKTAAKAKTTKSKDEEKKSKSASKIKLNTEIDDGNKKELIEKKEESIIEKIKSFLRKIIEMQEEAKDEVELIKDGIKDKKERKTKKAKLAKDPEKDIKETYLLEYYDLPYRYDETVVRILAQTPRKLFVYWDISDSDKQRYINTFGESFFNDTYPILLLYNEDKKYIKEIVVNDFANSWYINIDNPKTKYSVQLGRKFKNRPQIVNIAKMEEERIELQNDYPPMVNSNKIEAPNDRVLFDKFASLIKFRNVKTGQETVKDLSAFTEKISKAYDVPSFKQVFREINKSEAISDDRFDFDNPTSGNPTSTFK